MSNQQINIGIFGFGCVGQGLYNTLTESSKNIANIVKICVKDRAKFRPFPNSSFFTFNKDEILNNKDINVVVELIDDADAAYEIVTTAIRNGKAVVTANKKLIAEHLGELLALAQEHNVPLLYEAACCASIPIIRNLEEYYDNDLLHSIRGIFNGSTNYILTQLASSDTSYPLALAQAQERGFAETDPTYDVKGWDARYKLSIIIAHAFGIVVNPDHIFSFGIDAISQKDIQFAKEKGYTIKLVASAKKVENEIFAFVAPQFISKNDALATVDNEFNAVEIEGAFSEKQLFVGKGAGSYPTGAAVLSDISALQYQYRYEYKKISPLNTARLKGSELQEVYVSYRLATDISISDFETISESFIGVEHSFIVGTITLDKLQTAKWINHPDVSVIFTGNEIILPSKKERQKGDFELVE